MICYKKVFISCFALAVVLSFSSVHAYAAGNTTGVLTASHVNLRTGPAKSRSVIDSLFKGQRVSILSHSNYWYKIKTHAGEIGWVKKDYVVVKSTITSKSTSTPKITSSSKTKLISRGNSADLSNDRSAGVAERLKSYAKKFLGVPYVWGGSSSRGFDCSGFTQYIFSHFGITLERVAKAQASEGSRVSKDKLKPGDLVFFDTRRTQSNVNHAGIYIGDGEFIQASSGGSEVMISNLTKGFYSETYMTARRIL